MESIALINQLGKIPPQAVELEETVLGAILIESESIYKAIDVIPSSTFFYKDAHVKIFDAMLSLFNESKPIDLVTVIQELRRSGKLETCGGAYYLTELTTKVNSSANIDYHCRIIVQQAVKREIIKTGSEMSSEAFDETTDPFKLLDTANNQLISIQNYLEKKKSITSRQLVEQSILFTKTASEKKDHITGVPSKHSLINRIMGGWQPTDLIVIAARPSMGKTAFALNEAVYPAIHKGIPTAFFSLEMNAIQLMQRIQASECQIALDHIRRGTLLDCMWERLVFKSEAISNAPLFIDDSPGLSLFEFKVKLRKQVVENGVKLVIVDYLQLMTGNGNNRNEQIGSLSRGLKAAAKEFNIPIIALSQLSRAVESRGGDKKPMLSDLRDSGEIEQDADVVMFLYRPEYYGITEDADGFSTLGKALGIIAKNRNGSLDDVLLNFSGQYQSFYEDGYFENHKIQNNDMAPERFAGASLGDQPLDIGSDEFREKYF